MKNNISSKHHTIPQFYLNSFANRVEEYKINIFNKNKLKDYSNLVKNIGYIKNFNTIEINGIKTDIFEKLHNEVFEKKFSNRYLDIIRKIQKYNQIEKNCYNCMSIEYYKSNESNCIDYDDKNFISYLLSYFIYRGRKIRKVEEQFIGKLEGILKDIYIANGRIDNDTILNNIKTKIGTKEDVKINQLISLFKGKEITKLAKILYEHIWIVAYNNTNSLLYTSDNGHALDTNIEGQKTVGYDTEGNIIIFPITPRIVIFMCDSRCFSSKIKDLEYMDLSIDQVKIINNEIIFDAIDEIYSKDGNWRNLHEYYKKNKLSKGHKPYKIN